MAETAKDTGRRERKGGEPVRVWIDMCADVFHYGHARAIRQAKMMGDVLVVGVHPDHEVQNAKGAPVLGEKDRLAVVRECRWVDEVTGDAPYTTAVATLDKFDIDFCVHGEDISVGPDGRDSFYEVKQLGRFQLIKRTDGVSTTDLVTQMIATDMAEQKRAAAVAEWRLEYEQECAQRTAVLDATVNALASVAEKSGCLPDGWNDMWASTRSLVTGPLRSVESLASNRAAEAAASRVDRNAAITSGLMAEFIDGRKPAQPSDRVVYIAGAFDVLTTAEIDALREARSLGTFLVVGLWSDAEISARFGSRNPLMSVLERALLLLSMRCVDDVIMNAPLHPGDKLLENLKISCVAHVVGSDRLGPLEADPYATAKSSGRYHALSATPRDHQSIVERVIAMKDVYLAKMAKKAKNQELEASIAEQDRK